MSMMTYILIIGLSGGIGDNFNPELIETTATKCVFMSLLEISLIKAFFYFNFKNGSFLELLSFT